jgi:hypothetical protein
MPNYTPLALQHLDSSIGSRTVEAFSVATEQYPHLGGIAINLDNSHQSSFHPSELGLAGSHISIIADPSQYQDEIKKGITKVRMAEFSTMFRERGVLPSVPELVTSTFLHELGHAEDFYQYIQRAGGDVKAAFKLAGEVRKSEIAGLPLKGSSSAALNAWNQNKDEYRDKMEGAGFTPESFNIAVMDNLEAYTKLPCEQVADRFALGVLATMYS